MLARHKQSVTLGIMNGRTTMTGSAENKRFPLEAQQHYESINEVERLQRSTHRLEGLRTQQLLKRFLPPSPATIADVGGAAGAHAFWLAALGYDVHLLDIVPLHIEQACEREKRDGLRLASIGVGDACALPYENGSIDAVLLFGPLYHLTQRADRLIALREARRVLRPEGVMLAVSVNRFTSSFQGLFRDLNADALFRAMALRDLDTGYHVSPENRAFFTTTYFHHPDELVAEGQAAGFAIDAVVGVEGPGWLLQDFDHAWNDMRRREDMLLFAEKIESEPTLLGLSTHVMIVGRAGKQPEANNAMHATPEDALA
jgi:ubiquinone/menaquinone biosynthesis C-methylase UbiE